MDLREGSAAAASDEVAPAATATEAQPVLAQMPGKVLKILLNPGDAVNEGQAILVLEAMKMEVPVNAHAAGVVASIDVTIGQQVANHQQLATIG